jgi:diguanylate cyclase (GGDEF)-like protein/PAS domain S-box-containing protein
MGQETRIDDAARDAVLDALRRDCPGAHVVAIAPSGLFVPMPDGVELGTWQPIVGPASALALVVPEDTIHVIDAWDRATRTGAGNALVRPHADPSQQVRLHFVDLSHRYGVFLGFLAGFESSGDGPDLGEVALIKPKVAVMRKDGVAVITETDAAATFILGWTREELLGRRTLDLVHPDEHQLAIDSWMSMLARPGGTGRVRLRHRHRDGHWIWFEVTNHNRLADPAHGYVLAELLDITEEMAAQEALRASEQLLRRLTESLPVGVVQIDHDLRVVYHNARANHMLGTPLGESFGEAYRDAVVPADRVMLNDALVAVLDGGADADLEVGLVHPFRGVRRLTVSLRALSGSSGAVTGAIISLADITEDVRLREELKFSATFDSLTGCRNRASILGALHNYLALPACENAGVAAVFVDLDRFKQVNDRLGHAAGDALLVHVANRLRTAARHADLVGRLGGDEFLVVARDVASPADARTFAEKLASAICDGTVALGGEHVLPHGSVGVAWSLPGAHDADALIAAADEAMYRAKRTHTVVVAGETLGADPDVEAAHLQVEQVRAGR